MKTQKRKVEGQFLCVLMAIAVLMSLIVLPLAETIKQNASVSDSRYSDSDAADEGGSECVTDSQGAGKADFIYKNDDITVKAVFSDLSEVPDYTELQVTPITEGKDSGKYSEVKAQINENVQADNQTVTGFLAYDIYFMVNGTKYEPENGTVTVTIQYNHPLFNENIKKATDEIKVLHLKETGTETKVEDVTKTVDVADVGKDAATETKAEESSQAGSAINSEVSSATSSDAGSKTADADTVEFVTKSFSTFVITALAANLATNTITADAIADGLGIARNFAVFAQHFTLASSEVEGNVAANSFIGGGQLKLTPAVLSDSSTKFDLNISVSPGGVGRKVGIYTDSVGTTKIKNSPFTMDVNGTATVTGLDSNTVYYAYLMQSDGITPILSSVATTNKITSGNTVISTNNDNYIQTFKNHVTNSLFANGGVGPNIPTSITFGSSYSLTGGNASADGKTGNGKSSLMQSSSTTLINTIADAGVNCTANIAEKGKFPINFDSAFSALSAFSSSLSNLTQNLSILNATPSPTGTSAEYTPPRPMVINISGANGDEALRKALAHIVYSIAHGSEDENNVLTNTGITLGDQQCVVINVDCPSNIPVKIPACNIMGENYGTAYSENARRVIWNFYDSTNSGTKGYTGTVNISDGGVQGTILVPSGTVSKNGPTTNGAIYANTVLNNGGEIHKMTFRPKPNVGIQYVSFTVPLCNTTSLTVKKVWSDCGYSNSRPPSIIVRLLQNGVDINQTGTLYSSNNWSPCTFTNLPLMDSTNKAYIYTVVEEDVPYYTATYSTPTSAANAASISTLCTCPDPCDDTITITNTYTPAIVLPETGGTGTNLFYGAGVGIILFSAVLMIIYQLLEKQTKKRKGRRWRINSY
jgi:choice-of-anchor A domain-containing protein